jgi:hypothetical protein
MAPQQHDQNLMLVTAVEGYAQRYSLSEREVFALFDKYGVAALIRAAYEVLYTQNLEESINFADDILRWKQV